MRLWTLHPQYLDAQGLVALWREALLARAVLRGRTRGHSFDASKIGRLAPRCRLQATTGQLEHEWAHLMRKLRLRSRDDYLRLRGVDSPRANPLFTVVEGPVARGERA